MNYRKLVYGGIVLVVFSFLVGFIGITWGIYSSFDALKTSETAGIGAVRFGIETAFYSNIFSIAGVFFGTVLIILGTVKSHKEDSAK